MSVAVYAGSFDPITNGHLAVLRGGLRLAEKLTVVVGVHDDKKPLFSFKERKKLIEEAAKELLGAESARLSVLAFDTLMVTQAQKLGARFLIRGLRSNTDFDYEMQMASMNRQLAPQLQTVFLPAEDESRSVSSSIVRQIASMGGDISSFVPPNVARALAKKYSKH